MSSAAIFEGLRHVADQSSHALLDQFNVQLGSSGTSIISEAAGEESMKVECPEPVARSDFDNQVDDSENIHEVRSHVPNGVHFSYTFLRNCPNCLLMTYLNLRNLIP